MELNNNKVNLKKNQNKSKLYNNNLLAKKKNQIQKLIIVF